MSSDWQSLITGNFRDPPSGIIALINKNYRALGAAYCRFIVIEDRLAV